MVKSVTHENNATETSRHDKCVRVGGAERDSDSGKYKGVRKRKWGKWVSEIRLPNSRERIWLGSFDSAFKAARAFDAALYCLRGPTAKFNFPDNPPEIPGGRLLTPPQIQTAAVRFANSEGPVGDSGRLSSCSSGSGSPARSDVSVSHGSTHLDSELAMDFSFLDDFSGSNLGSGGLTRLDSEVPLDISLLDQFETTGSGWGNDSVSGLGMYPGFDDFSNDYFVRPPLVDYNEVEEVCDEFTTQGSSYLWNF